MKIFGRTPSRVLSAVLRLPSFLAAAVRCFRLFRHPLQPLWGYVRSQSPPSRRVVLRSGMVIHLSEDHSDIVTVFLVFCRRDYGTVAPGSVVVDIGANIGVFSLYSAFSGARSVNAFEPSAESFACLQKNIEINRLGNVIHATRAAVFGRPTPPVWFPKRSSVYNQVVAGAEAHPDRELVPTTTLAEIVAGLPKIDFIKLDCEGGEFDIVLNSPDAVFAHIAEMRLEFHHGPQAEMFAALTRLGYQRRLFVDEGDGSGYLWLVREAKA